MPIGTSVHQGTELAVVYGGVLPDEEVRRGLVFGMERTFDQDPLLLADRRLDIGRIPDRAGVVRVTVPMPTWEDFLGAALDELMVAAAGSPMVLLRIRALPHKLRAAVPRERHSPAARRPP